MGTARGRADTILVRDGAVTGLRVLLAPGLPDDVRRQPLVAKAAEASPERPAAVFALDQIRPDPGTGLIIPVTRKEMGTGTGAGRCVLASPGKSAWPWPSPGTGKESPVSPLPEARRSSP